MYRIVAIIAIFAVVFAAGFFVGSHNFNSTNATRELNLKVVDGGTYRVRRVIDGDTVELENGLHIRYLGVNAPETGHFVHDLAPLAADATKRNMQLVEGKDVRVKLAAEPLDPYGRVVAQLFVPSDSGKEIDVGRTLLTEGLARVMGLGVTAEQNAELKKIEEDARAAKRGLWGLEDKSRGAEGADKPYCASSTGKVYHLNVCTLAKRIKPENMHQYASSDDAETAGYKPCTLCVIKQSQK